MSQHLVIGLGEIGSSLQRVIHADGIGYGDFAPQEAYKFIHICYPYSEEFVKSVTDYAKEFQAEYVVVHSTVPLGTCNKIQRYVSCTHSPVRGVHPTMDEGIRTLTKFFGGKDAQIVADEFEKMGVDTITTKNSKNTEAGKMWSTTQYGLFIIMMHQIKDYCDEQGVDFDIVYRQFNETYNEGYLKLGRPEVVRPALKYMSGKIGGHCVIPNCELLGTDIGDFILKSNKKL